MPRVCALKRGVGGRRNLLSSIGGHCPLRRQRGGNVGSHKRTSADSVPRPHQIHASLGRSAKLTARRFPPPWSVEELDACFVVRDHSGISASAWPRTIGRLSLATIPWSVSRTVAAQAASAVSMASTRMERHKDRVDRRRQLRRITLDGLR